FAGGAGFSIFSGFGAGSGFFFSATGAGAGVGAATGSTTGATTGGGGAGSGLGAGATAAAAGGFSGGALRGQNMNTPMPTIAKPMTAIVILSALGTGFCAGSSHSSTAMAGGAAYADGAGAYG